MKLSQLEPLDRVPRHVQDTVFTLSGTTMTSSLLYSQTIVVNSIKFLFLVKYTSWELNTVHLNIKSKYLSCSAAVSRSVPSRPPLGQTGRWFRTGGCCTVLPRWSGGPGCPSPSALWTPQSDSLCRPLRSLSWGGSCLWVDHNFYSECHLRADMPQRRGAFILKVKSEPTCLRNVVLLLWRVDRRLGGLTRDAGPELVGELGDEVVIDPILHGAEDDDGPRVVHWNRKWHFHHLYWSCFSDEDAGSDKECGLTFLLDNGFIRQNKLLLSTCRHTEHAQ